MRWWCRLAAISMLAAGIMLPLGSGPSMAESRGHVYLLRGLMNIFSLGMDTLSAELNKRGVYATVHNHSEWQGLADQAAARYKAGTEGPIILIGHSLGADAVMEMAAYLGRKGVPVALVVPFDGTGSYAASSNVARVMNLTQRDYAYMRRGPGFKGTLVNVDVSSDHNIDHLNIDKSPRLHARVIAEVLAVVGGHRIAVPGEPNAPKPASAGAPGEPGAVKPAGGEAKKPEPAPAAPTTHAAPAKTGDGAKSSTEAPRPVADSGTPVIALPERRSAPAASAAPVATPPRKPAVSPQPAGSAALPD
jgi:thioesterase superfamily protein